MTTISTASLLLHLTNLSDNLIKEIYDSIAFSGFNRDLIISELNAKKASLEVVSTLAFLGAVRGGKLSKLEGLELKTEVKDFMRLHIAKDHKDNPRAITILRITATFPQVAAYMLMRSDAPKKIESSDLPAFLQFPAAGSLPLNDSIRELHKEFCINFSKLINGKFDESIYEAMQANPIKKEECPQQLRTYLR